MQELKYQQQFNEQVFIDANLNEKNGREDKIPAVEAHLVHAEYYTPQFNRTTGLAEHVPQRNAFGYLEFQKLEKDKAFDGMKVTILHMPEDPTLTNLKKARENNLRQLNAERQAGGESNPGLTGGTGEGEGQGAGTTGGEGDNGGAPAKSVSSMNKTELTALYSELFGVAPDPAVTVAELKELIKEKQDESK